MSKQPTYKKILEHPDKDEIIAKLVIGQPPADIHDWLKAKYTNVNEKKFVLAESILKSFHTNYLDFYNDILQDIQKTKTAVATGSPVDALDLAVKNNPAYEDAMVKLATGELNIDQMMAKMAVNVETRFAQIYDIIQEDPRNINTRTENLWVKMGEMMQNLLDKYYKWKESQAQQTMLHSGLTLQMVDQHIAVFHDVIKEVLSQMDLETSLYFMEVFNEKMNKLKMPDPAAPSTETKLAEAKVLNETINRKINEK